MNSVSHCFTFIQQMTNDVESYATRRNHVWASIVSLWTESIKRFIEDQAFSLSLVWLFRHTPPYFRQKVVSLSQSSCVSPVELTDGIGGEGEVGAKSDNGKKPGPLEILSAFGLCCQNISDQVETLSQTFLLKGNHFFSKS
jgi:hypothetical protein